MLAATLTLALKAYAELSVKDRLFKARAWPHVVLAGGWVATAGTENTTGH